MKWKGYLFLHSFFPCFHWFSGLNSISSSGPSLAFFLPWVNVSNLQVVMFQNISVPQFLTPHFLFPSVNDNNKPGIEVYHPRVTPLAADMMARHYLKKNKRTAWTDFQEINHLQWHFQTLKSKDYIEVFIKILHILFVFFYLSVCLEWVKNLAHSLPFTVHLKSPLQSILGHTVITVCLFLNSDQS